MIKHVKKYLTIFFISLSFLFYAPFASLNGSYAQAKKKDKEKKKAEDPKGLLESTGAKDKEKIQKAGLVNELLTDIEKVQTSIDIVKDEIDQTRDKKYLPTLLLRLAELYVEKSRLIYYKLKEEMPVGKRGDIKSPEAMEAKELAIETYNSILRDYPGFEENVKVHFFMAHELREIGNIRGMLNQYETIVKNYPRSKYRGEALLLLGDYHFDRKRIRRAADYYSKIIRSNLGHTITSMARYKLAWCYLNEQDFKRALYHFEKIALEAKQQEKEAQNIDSVEERLGKSTLVREALIDSVLCFTEIKKPKDSIPYYKHLADSEITYAKVLEKLANRLYIKREIKWSTRLYRELLQISGELEDNIEYLKRVLQHSRDVKNRRQAVEDIDFLIRNLNRYLHSFRVPDEDKRMAYKQFEVFARDISTKLHLKADETKKSEYYDASAKAYKQYLTLFKDSKYAKDMQFNFAETLYASKKYLEAGEQYETLYDKTTNKKEKSDALFAAVSSYFDAIKDPKSMDKVQLIDARQGFLKTATRYITEFPKSKKTKELKFAIGRTHYDLDEYDQAIQAFTKYINDYPDDKMTPEAGKLILDCFNTRKDYAGLVQQGKLLLANNKITNRKFKKEISELVKKTEFVMIQEKSGKGRLSREQGDFSRDFQRYADKYRGTELGEKALYNAFVGYRNKKKRKLTFISGTQFIIEYPRSKFLEDVLPSLGTIAFEVANYDKACRFFEDFYRKFPREPRAVKLLEKAAKLRTALSDSREAISDYQKLLNSGRAGNAAEIYQEMAVNYERLGDFREMTGVLEQARNLGAETVELNSKLAWGYYKSRNFGKAKQAVERTMKIASGKGSARLSQDEMSALAQAKFITTEITFVNLKNIKLGRGRANEQKLVNRKNRLLEDMKKDLAEISNYRDPKWTIATIFRIGQAYNDFANFLGQTSVPGNLNAAQKKEYRQLLNQKISLLKKEGNDTLKTALSRAYSLNIFNNWVKSCHLGYYVKEKYKTRGYSSISKADQKSIDDLYLQLLDRPTSTKILNRIALLYMRNGDYGKAKTILGRSLEIRSRSSYTNNNLGVAHWYLGEDQESYLKFSKAISLSAKNPTPRINIAALYYEYGNGRALRTSIGQLKSLKKVNLNAINIIPPAKRALGR